ncbi:hypothetical protein AM1BK_34500 [Neobacillus kokaensis]|uniref:Uncharacterized protein n=1 Tax=Neobacillus kokaensis TaxID=2759023 RepID=A0ABQ3N8E8_9BACI|nr:hypothetical protein AM1BK_34500 [Neobacillus kokaensis]
MSLVLYLFSKIKYFDRVYFIRINEELQDNFTNILFSYYRKVVFAYESRELDLFGLSGIVISTRFLKKELS